jgi:Tfp pilus assembly protein PilN
LEIADYQTFIFILKSGNIQFIHSLNFGTQNYLTSSQCLKTLIEDFQKILASYNQENKITKIMLSFTNSELVPVLKQLEKTLKLPLDTGEGTIEKKELRLEMVAVGLASAPKSKINLLPDKAQKTEKLKSQFVYIKYFLLGVSFLILVFLGLLYIRTLRLDYQITEIKTKLNDPNIQFQRLNKIENKIQKVQKLNTGRMKIARKSVSFLWDDLLTEFANLVPQGVHLIQIEAPQGQQMILRGEAKAIKEAFNFVQLLNTSKYFKEANLQNIKQIKEKKLFDFNISLERTRL